MDCIRRNYIAASYALDANSDHLYAGPMTTTTVPRPNNFAFFMHLKSTTSWLKLTPPERFGFVDEVIRPMLANHPAVAMRYFDAEAFSADVTDIALWETQDVMAFQALVEDLRESLFWGTYFEVVTIVPGIENAYATHYKLTPV
jgi:Darcynin, domain of unknown function